METLSEICKGNTVKGRQRFSLNFCNVNESLSFGVKTKWSLCPPTPHMPGLAPCDLLFFPGMNQVLKGRRFADFAEVQRESLVALDSISVEDFRQCFHQWERRWDRCIQSQAECFEGD